MSKSIFFRGHNKCFIVAEISANHGQSFNRAVALIKKAKKCGVDAVKFQAFTPDTITINCRNKYFKIKHPKWGGQTLYELYKKAYTPWKWFKKLKATADDLGIMFFATVFDKTSVDMLEELDVPIHKIASFELVDLPLIEYVAKTRKPVVMSTGMATSAEIKEAVTTAKKAGAKDIVLLKCVSSYPAKPEEMNLKSIFYLQKKFKCVVGLSDHTLGTTVPVTAVALGAKVIEKHFTLSRKNKTLDAFFSIEPKELRELVDNVRIAENSIAQAHYGLSKEETKSKIFRRSLFVVADMKRGEKFTINNVRSIRPGYGLLPKFFKDVTKYKASNDIKRGTPLTWSLMAENK